MAVTAVSGCTESVLHVLRAQDLTPANVRLMVLVAGLRYHAMSVPARPTLQPTMHPLQVLS